MSTALETKRLGQLARLINRCQDGVENGAKSMLEMARDMGEFLIEAKEKVPHGEWQAWIEENCSRVAYHQTAKYMRLAKKWDEIGAANVTSKSLLSIDAALDLVKEPKPKEQPDGQAEGYKGVKLTLGEPEPLPGDGTGLAAGWDGQPVQGDLLGADDEPVDLDAKPRPEFVGYNLDDDEPTPRVFLAEFCSLWEEADDMGRMAIATYAMENLQEFSPIPDSLPPRAKEARKRAQKRKPKASKNGKKSSEYTAGFEAFWKAWPSGKRKVKKGDCFKAWQKALDMTTVEVIMEASGVFCSSPEGLGKYCPGPTPWLNGRRWEDDRESWQNGGDDKPTLSAMDQSNEVLQRLVAKR